MKILIIDDERRARAELERMLRHLLPGGKILQAASSGEALDAHTAHPADLLLLDIQMPGGSGFELLERLPSPLPAVIFTTAHDQFALRAFEANALDYLLKPFSEKRLSRALAKYSAPEGIRPFLSTDDTILIKLDGECRLVPVGEILLIESDGNGSIVHGKGFRGRVNKTLSSMTDLLDPSLFFRTSRDNVINVSRALSFDTSGGTVTALLAGGKRIPFSRRQSALFRKTNRI